MATVDALLGHGFYSQLLDSGNVGFDLVQNAILEERGFYERFSVTENFDSKYIRVSLRSKGRIDVNRFAIRFFNGGGHRNAAGGRLYMPLEDVPAYFEQALADWPEEEKFS